MSESWQDWDSPEYMEFLELFYKMQLDLAYKIAGEWHSIEGGYTVAIFGKVAPPSHYLKAEYEAWLRKQKANEIPEREPVTSKSKTEWKPTKTEGTFMCSERYVTDEELAKAKDTNDGNIWFSPPGEGYRWGLVFRKVVP